MCKCVYVCKCVCVYTWVYVCNCMHVYVNKLLDVLCNNNIDSLSLFFSFQNLNVLMLKQLFLITIFRHGM